MSDKELKAFAEKMNNLVDLQSALVQRFCVGVGDYKDSKSASLITSAWLSSGGLRDVLQAQSPTPGGSTSIDMIILERARQIREEGWSPEHDDKWTDEELASAAAYYASPTDKGTPIHWPWAREWNKKEQHSRIRQLVIAGALIVAELDRLQRAALAEAFAAAKDQQ